ncbi:XkdQ/YqbQ family protein [Gorillibacterium timonense]|uniref:XkdQ/YqbQ family protein n=1 Tax=Gorillibacterium timonense TaxID=1689269 RepID=UPI00071D1009|nr:hypothetical protein [Gorillibacterium timonense]
MLEVMLDNRNGNLWDISSIVTDASWKTSRIGKPSTFGFSYVKGSPFEDSRFKLEPGDIISVRKDGKGIFFGYVFTIDNGMEEKATVTAYDQIRYLQANDSYTFTNTTATAIIRRIINDYKLKAGSLAQTVYTIPNLAMKDKKLIDTICTALQHTVVGEKKIYTFFDDYGELALRNSEEMLLEMWIGDGSLMTGYEYSRSIDDETYNYILMKRDSESKENPPIVWKDSSTISKWGRLQLFKQIDQNMNNAQINELGKNLLALHNRERKKLTLEALGDLRVRAGCYLRVYLEEVAINQPFLVEECSHEQLEEDVSIMKLELKVI